MKRTIINEYKRVASKTWHCNKCNKCIHKGSEYIDKEIKEYIDGLNAVIIRHERSCMLCSGRSKQNRRPLNYPEVCTLVDGTKVEVLGIVHNPNPIYLIRNMVDNRYYFKKSVIDFNCVYRVAYEEFKQC